MGLRLQGSVGCVGTQLHVVWMRGGACSASDHVSTRVSDLWVPSKAAPQNNQEGPGHPACDLSAAVLARSTAAFYLLEKSYEKAGVVRARSS